MYTKNNKQCVQLSYDKPEKGLPQQTSLEISWKLKLVPHKQGQRAKTRPAQLK